MKKSKNMTGFFCSDGLLKLNKTLERNLNKADMFDKKFFKIEK